MLSTESRTRNFLVIVFISSLLVACGGSSSNDAGGTPPPAGNNPPPDPVTRNIDLSWSAPVMRTDGSSASLSDIGGYKLYVGTVSGVYNPAIDLGNTTAHTLASMATGTYYLALSAYDTNALESARSSEFAVTVN